VGLHFHDLRHTRNTLVSDRAERRRNPRAIAMTCGFVVARGGVELPTFRFSGRKCPSGEVA